MIVSFSAAAKVAVQYNNIDCGFTFKCEGRSKHGGFIIKPSQLDVAGLSKLHCKYLTQARAIREDGKVFENVACIAPQFIVVVSE